MGLLDGLSKARPKAGESHRSLKHAGKSKRVVKDIHEHDWGAKAHHHFHRHKSVRRAKSLRESGDGGADGEDNEPAGVNLGEQLRHMMEEHPELGGIVDEADMNECVPVGAACAVAVAVTPTHHRLPPLPDTTSTTSSSTTWPRPSPRSPTTRT